MAKKRRRPPPEEGPPDVAPAHINQVLFSSNVAAPQCSINGAKLAIELLESATTQLVQRMGWFRDVRLRRVADAFLRSSKIYQQAYARWESESGGYGFEKPSQAKIEEYTEELKKHVEQLQATRVRAASNNERREINIKAAYRKTDDRTAQRLKEIKERAAEVSKNPNSVIKANVRKKRQGVIAKKKNGGIASDAGAITNFE